MSKKIIGICFALLALSALPGCVAYPAYGPGYYGPPRAYGYGYGYGRPYYHGGWGYYR